MDTITNLTRKHGTAWETPAALKRLAAASRQLAELKGVSASVPNPAILINSLVMQEAKDSSAIENIVTTHDDLYRESLFPEFGNNLAAKEVRRYVQALSVGFELVKEHGLLTANYIVQIQRELEGNSAGFRELPGTELKNAFGQTVYIPPQDPATIVRLMSDLEQFLNDDSLLDADPLIKMAIIHHQFESIHPFYDGNGRTGRIINVLYLVQKGLLDYSRFVPEPLHRPHENGILPPFTGRSGFGRVGELDTVYAHGGRGNGPADHCDRPAD